VTSPQAVRQIFQQKPNDFEKQQAQRVHLRRLVGHGLVSAEGDYHKNDGKSSFRHSNMNTSTTGTASSERRGASWHRSCSIMFRSL
jgi:hypothetical protein